MTTTVSAVMRRSYTADMFADLCVPPHTRAWDKATGVTTLTFAADLTAEQVDVIRDRMTSRDDTDQAARAALRADCAALPVDDPRRRLYCYVLGVEEA